MSNFLKTTYPTFYISTLLNFLAKTAHTQWDTMNTPNSFGQQDLNYSKKSFWGSWEAQKKHTNQVA